MAGTKTEKQTKAQRLKDVYESMSDERFKALGRRLADAIGQNASFAVVPGSNHACQLERPSETRQVIWDFFSRTGGG